MTGKTLQAAMTQQIDISETFPSPRDTSLFLLEMLGGLRELCGRSKEYEFLDYLLAMAVEEAERLVRCNTH